MRTLGSSLSDDERRHHCIRERCCRRHSLRWLLNKAMLFTAQQQLVISLLLLIALTVDAGGGRYGTCPHATNVEQCPALMRTLANTTTTSEATRNENQERYLEVLNTTTSGCECFNFCNDRLINCRTTFLGTLRCTGEEGRPYVAGCTVADLPEGMALVELPPVANETMLSHNASLGDVDYESEQQQQFLAFASTLNRSDLANASRNDTSSSSWMNEATLATDALEASTTNQTAAAVNDTGVVDTVWQPSVDTWNTTTATNSSDSLEEEPASNWLLSKVDIAHQNNTTHDNYGNETASDATVVTADWSTQRRLRAFA